MKIGIVTFQRAQNFGAQMQMYALYSFLRKYGHEVWILDYYCKPLEYDYAPIHRYVTRTVLNGIYHLLKDFKAVLIGFPFKKYKSYNKFLKQNFKLTYRFCRPEDMPTAFDVLITGSDQVWNYAITGGRDEVFFLDNKIGNNYSLKKISYAASVEKNNYFRLINDKNYVAKTLKHFHWISTRENTLAEFIRKEFDLKADTVLDPTFLLSRYDYIKIASKPKFKHYLLVYEVNKSSNLINVAKKISNERGLKIVYSRSAPIAVDVYSSYGPLELLGLICYADVVVTSSFHGTALSIINRKEFYSVYDVAPVRVEDLLRSFNLRNRMIVKPKSDIQIGNINYDDEIIDKNVSRSKQLLLKAFD